MEELARELVLSGLTACEVMMYLQVMVRGDITDKQLWEAMGLPGQAKTAARRIRESRKALKEKGYIDYKLTAGGKYCYEVRRAGRSSEISLARLSNPDRQNPRGRTSEIDTLPKGQTSTLTEDKTLTPVKTSEDKTLTPGQTSAEDKTLTPGQTSAEDKTLTPVKTSENRTLTPVKTSENQTLKSQSKPNVPLKETSRKTCESSLKKTQTKLRQMQYERERLECAKCKGMPCRKESCKGYSLRKIGETYERKCCKYYEQYLRDKKTEQRRKESGLPEEYAGSSWADYDCDANNMRAVQYARGALERGAYFFGEPGTGKTYLASLIGYELLRHGRTVLFVKTARMLKEFHEVYRGESSESELEKMRRLSEVEWLILDDFGLEKPTQYAGAQICQVLDERRRKGKNTLITGNYPLQEVCRRLDAAEGGSKNGSRIYDRVRTMCEQYRFGGRSRRGKI